MGDDSETSRGRWRKWQMNPMRGRSLDAERIPDEPAGPAMPLPCPMAAAECMVERAPVHVLQRGSSAAGKLIGGTAHILRRRSRTVGRQRRLFGRCVNCWRHYGLHQMRRCKSSKSEVTDRRMVPPPSFANPQFKNRRAFALFCFVLRPCGFAEHAMKSMNVLHFSARSFFSQCTLQVIEACGTCVDFHAQSAAREFEK